MFIARAPSQFRPNSEAYTDSFRLIKNLRPQLRPDSFATSTTSEMHCLRRSPGGSKVIKTKLGTSRNQQVLSIRKLFEHRATTTTEGNIELLSQSTLATNLNPGMGVQNQFGTRRKETFCVSQPAGGYWTGPRQPGGTLFWPETDWSSEPEFGRCSQSQGLCDD